MSYHVYTIHRKYVFKMMVMIKFLSNLQKMSFDESQKQIDFNSENSMFDVDVKGASQPYQYPSHTHNIIPVFYCFVTKCIMF